MKIKSAARFAGVSERTLRSWLKQNLRHSRLPTGTVLIKEEWIDEWLEKFSTKENQVDEIVKSLTSNLLEVKDE